MKKHLLFLFFLVPLIINKVNAQSGTFILETVADTYIRGASLGDTNYGTDTVVVTRYNSGADYRRDGFLKFDTRGYSFGTEIIVTLNMYNNTPASEQEHGVYEINDDSWTETGITWNNAPEQGDSITSATIDSVGWYEWDITKYFIEQMNLDSIISLKTFTEGRTIINYSSRENPDGNAPYLKIVVTSSTKVETNADTYVRGAGLGDTNFGTDSVIVTRYNSGIEYRRDAFLKFDVNGYNYGLDIQKVTLNMFNNTPASEQVHGIYEINDDSWTETGITWNNAPEQGDSITSATIDSIGWYEWDITDFFTEQTTLDGIISLKTYTEGRTIINYSSRENPDGNAPYINIVSASDEPYSSAIAKVNFAGEGIEVNGWTSVYGTKTTFPVDLGNGISMDISEGAFGDLPGDPANESPLPPDIGTSWNYVSNHEVYSIVLTINGLDKTAKYDIDAYGSWPAEGAVQLTTKYSIGMDTIEFDADLNQDIKSFTDIVPDENGAIEFAISNIEGSYAAINALMITKQFEEPVDYILSTSVLGEGTVYPESGLFREGSSVTLNAIPAEGWRFKNWSGDITGINTSVDITMDSHKDIIAVFEELGNYVLDTIAMVNFTKEGSDEVGYTSIYGNNSTFPVDLGNGLAITKSEGNLEAGGETSSGTPFPENVGSTLNSLANDQEYTINWTVSGLDPDKVYDFCIFSYWINSSIEILSRFNVGTDTITVDSKEQQDILFTNLTPNENGEITFGFSNKGANNACINALMIGEQVAPTIEEYTLTTVTFGEGSISPESGTYDEGTVVTLTATPESGWKLKSWTGDVVGISSTIDVIMDNDKEIIAIFEQTGNYQYDTIARINFTGRGGDYDVEGWTSIYGTEITYPVDLGNGLALNKTEGAFGDVGGDPVNETPLPPNVGSSWNYVSSHKVYTLEFTISGLDTEETYALDMYGFWPADGAVLVKTKFSVGSDTIAFDADGNQEIVTFSSLKPNEEGDLKFSVTNDENSYAAINGVIVKKRSGSTSSVSELNSFANLSYYPVPCKDGLTLSNLPVGSSVAVYSVIGNKMKETVNTKEELTLDMRPMKAGIYIITVSDLESSNVKTFKIVKK